MKKITWLLMLMAAWMVSSCGEYFASEIPDEYDPENLPNISGITVNSSYDLFVGEKVQLSSSALSVDNGLSFARQGNDVQEYLLNTMVWSAQHGDSVVKARATDLCITAMARGTDTVTFYNAERAIGSCLFRVYDGTEPPTAIRTDRVTIAMTEGMDWTPSLTFEPSYCRNLNVAWESGNTDVATVSDEGTITAVRAGTTTVTVTAADAPDVHTQIIVTVLPNWVWQRMGHWRYETIVYARLYIDGEDCTLNYRNTVAALIGGDCHGIGEARTWHEKPYMVFRIGNNALPDAENSYPIDFMGYNSEELVIIDFDETFDFDGEVHGTLSNPVLLHGTRRD